MLYKFLYYIHRLSGAIHPVIPPPWPHLITPRGQNTSTSAKPFSIIRSISFATKKTFFHSRLAKAVHPNLSPQYKNMLPRKMTLLSLHGRIRPGEGEPLIHGLGLPSTITSTLPSLAT